MNRLEKVFSPLDLSSNVNDEQDRINNIYQLAKGCESLDQFDKFYEELEGFIQEVFKEVFSKAQNENVLKNEAVFDDGTGLRKAYFIHTDSNGNAKRGILIIAEEGYYSVHIGPMKNYKPDINAGEKAVKR